jgi:hypothetical protein
MAIWFCSMVLSSSFTMTLPPASAPCRSDYG